MILEIPELEDSIQAYPPRAAGQLSDPAKSDEILAFACGTYNGVGPEAYNSHRSLSAQLGMDYGKNLWIIPSYPRLAYPYSALYAVASMIKTEAKAERRADWLLWLDDDVLVPSDLVRVLRNAADPVDRPFVSALAYDRQPPFKAAVWSTGKTEEGGEYRKQWEHEPKSGTFEVSSVGLCAALFHRSLFDRVPQPWFAVVPREVTPDGKVVAGVNPDAWWSQRCRNEGIPLYVCCDVTVVHMGLSVPVHRGSVEVLRKVCGGPE